MRQIENLNSEIDIDRLKSSALGEMQGDAAIQLFLSYFMIGIEDVRESIIDPTLQKIISSDFDDESIQSYVRSVFALVSDYIGSFKEVVRTLDLENLELREQCKKIILFYAEIHKDIVYFRCKLISAEIDGDAQLRSVASDTDELCKAESEIYRNGIRGIVERSEK